MFSLQERRFPFIGDDLIELDRSVENLVTKQIRDVGRYDPAHVYTFFIDVLGRLLEADYLGGPLANDRIAKIVKGSVFLRFPPCFDIPYEWKDSEASGEFIPLDAWNVACDFDKSNTLSYSMKNVMECGYRNTRNQDWCKGLAYPLLNFAVIYNARHRASACRVLHNDSLQMEAQKVDIKPLFSDLRINTHMEWCNSEGNLYRCNLPDPRFALMYDFARRRDALLASKETYIKNRDHICRLLSPKQESYDLRYVLPEDGLMKAITQTSRKKPTVIGTADDLTAWQKLLLRMAGLDLKQGFLVRR